MAHLAKYPVGACGGMMKHYDRTAEVISNEEVDSTKSHLNYDLANNEKVDLFKKMKERIEDVYVYGRKKGSSFGRKDMVVMMTWVVTLPKNVEGKDEDKFFKSTYEFLEKKYGKENTISACVHKDETTPHMHYSFVPVVEDKKKKREKLSAKEKVTKQDLKVFHKELFDCIKASLGYEVDILNGETVKNVDSVKELKKLKAAEELKELQSEITNLKEEREKITIEIDNLRSESLPEVKKYKAYADELKFVYSSYNELNEHVNFNDFRDFQDLGFDKAGAKVIKMPNVPLIPYKGEEVFICPVKTFNNHCEDLYKSIYEYKIENKVFKKSIDDFYNGYTSEKLEKTEKELGKIEKEFLDYKKQSKTNNNAVWKIYYDELEKNKRLKKEIELINKTVDTIGISKEDFDDRKEYIKHNGNWNSKDFHEQKEIKEQRQSRIEERKHLRSRGFDFGR